MATEGAPYVLSNRGVVAISGEGCRDWLDNLVTNDLTTLAPERAVFAALLSPQGKILFEFFVFLDGARLLLDVLADSVPALIKRLTLYRLRAPLAFADASADFCVVWSNTKPELSAAIASPDPRAPTVLWRALVPAEARSSLQAEDHYAARRIALGVAEAPADYALGDTFPHEANFDIVDGVSFTKGCYIGQEVVSRMQNKGLVRKRVVRVSASNGDALVSGHDVSAGTATIGRIGTVAGSNGLAMIRLDRALEAEESAIPVTSNGVPITVDDIALTAFVRARSNRPAHDLL